MGMPPQMMKAARTLETLLQLLAVMMKSTWRTWVAGLHLAKLLAPANLQLSNRIVLLPETC